MRAPVTFAILTLLAAGCDSATPTDPPAPSEQAIAIATVPAPATPRADPRACVADPTKANGWARIVSITHVAPAASGCEQSPDTTRPDGNIAIKDGAILGAPMRLTSVKSHASKDSAIQCVYDLVGFVDVAQADEAGTPLCSFRVNFETSIPVPVTP